MYLCICEEKENRKKKTQVDQNGVVYDPKTDRKSCKNGAFTTVYDVKSASFRSVLHRIIGRRITDRIISVS